MQSILIPKKYPLEFKIFRIAIALTLVFAIEIPIGSNSAEANILADTYFTVSDFVATTVGYDACGYPCAAGAALAMHATNAYVPVAAKSAVEYVKPGIIQMFTNWGTSFFRP